MGRLSEYIIHNYIRVRQKERSNTWTDKLIILIIIGGASHGGAFREATSPAGGGGGGAASAAAASSRGVENGGGGGGATSSRRNTRAHLIRRIQGAAADSGIGRAEVQTIEYVVRKFA